MKYFYQCVAFDAIVEPTADASVRYLFGVEQNKVKILKIFPKLGKYNLPKEGKISWLTLDKSSNIIEPNDIMKKCTII